MLVIVCASCTPVAGARAPCKSLSEGRPLAAALLAQEGTLLTTSLRSTHDRGR